MWFVEMNKLRRREEEDDNDYDDASTGPTIFSIIVRTAQYFGPGVFKLG